MRDKSLATAVATLLAAFATAHLMQFGLSAGRLASGDRQAAPIGLATLVAGQADALPAALPEGPATLPDAAVAAGGLSLPAARDFPRDTGVPAEVHRPAANALGLSCERRLAAEAGPDAVLRTTVLAPCDPGVRVEIRHDGLRFAVETGPDGRIDVVVPAMSADAALEAHFADGTVLYARAAVPEAVRLERVAVVADGWSALALHAFEFGARRGSIGHVHSGAQLPRMGALHRLGDPGIGAPLLSEVYTLPSGRLGSLGGVRLEIEAVVTPANCARDIAADIVASSGDGSVTRSGLQLAMPSCEAAGDVLVIDLRSPDLRIAGK
jgi:hypothetical protein